ncbi:MAG: trypsin-like peptidase domain-containing protein [Oscillatoriales cyanobacterium C42_A2020_001]|nr:trypsin-like peptidase domain-containing protein [Leptolyngbyaceae cyanobacterium C42_A2020_001]
MQDSVVLITSSDRDNNRFGTGFVLRQAGGVAYILTCLHVVKDVGGVEQALVDGIPAVMAASGEAKGLDLAVLRVEGLWHKPALPWNISGEKGRSFATAGFQLFGKDHLIRSLRGTLGDQGGLQAGADRIPVWDLRITDDYTLQPGYSGSPLQDELTGNVIGIVSHRQGEGRSGLAISIAALEKVWKFVDSRQLYEDLMTLGFEKQTRSFRRFIQASKVGAFLVHGPSYEYGQRWLVNRLVQKFITYCLTAGKVVQVKLYRASRSSDVNAVWRELSKKVGCQPDPALIVDRVWRWWKTQHVLLVFEDVNWLSPEMLRELIQHFWLPLARQAKTLQTPDVKFMLLLFLVDYEDSTEMISDVQFAEELDAAWEPTIPVRSPRITEFSDDDLIRWIDERFDRLPMELTQDVDRTVKVILDNTDNGVPEPTLRDIWKRCGCDWDEELEPCLKL